MHSKTFFGEVAAIANSIDVSGIENMARELAALRARDGRLFFLGVGGSAANCSHAVNDFRKLCGIEAYTPVDNVSELTARTNEGLGYGIRGMARPAKRTKRRGFCLLGRGGKSKE
jgi:D-sedoheptulose 7-phosphate isomerase